MVKLTSKDWVRMLIAFLLGVAVTLLVIQLTGGQLFQGALIESLYVAPTTTDTRTVEKTVIDDPFSAETQDVRNTGDGIDLAETAEGALDSGTTLESILERLNSGLRINTAKDDASGMAILEVIETGYMIYVEPSGLESLTRDLDEGKITVEQYDMMVKAIAAKIISDVDLIGRETGDIFDEVGEELGYCGNAICESNENRETCPADCAL